MLAWVVLGSAITLVVAFAVTTNYYRRRARKAERRSSPLSRTKYIHKDVEQNHSSNSSRDRRERGKHRERSRHRTDIEESGDFECESASSSGHGGERYDLRGGKHEQNCFI